jgi:putative tryptophan/tyrosine transport system substrate-binding protein
MDRRGFLLTSVAGTFAAPFGAHAQHAVKIPRVGFLTTVPLSSLSDRLGSFRHGLRDLGYVEGQNIRIVYRSAEGQYERLPRLAAELVRENVDVIVTTGQPAPEAARKATRTIPIVFAVVGDPVADGLVARLDRPGGNLTGLSSIAPDVVGKQLEILKEVVPRLSRVGIVRDPAHQGHLRIVQQAKGARALGLRVVVVDVDGASALDKAFRRMAAEGVQGALVLRGALFVHLRERLAELAIKAALPTMFGHPEEAEAGGLMAYGTDLPALYRRAAAYVDKILKGGKPSDLPVEQPTKFKLIINLKTAKALGVTMPPSLLLRADQVIE